MADTAPGKIDPSTLDGYEPPPAAGETQREKRNRKARNRRLAERHQAQADAAGADAAGPPPPKRGRPSGASKRAQSVSGIVTGIGIAVYAFDQHDGTTIIEGAGDLGTALANVAEKNAKVAKALDALGESSAWAEVAVAVGGIGMPIAAHHGMSLLNRRDPDLDLDPDPDPDAGAAAPPPTGHVDDTGPAQTSTTAPVFSVRTDTPPADVPTFHARP